MKPSSSHTRPDILIVDDREENLIALEALLEACDGAVHRATSGNQALALSLKKEFALVLLDVQMPGMDGFEVAELMRLNARTRRIPIIFVTAISKEQRHIFKGYEAGAVDYLPKPVEPLILQSKVNVFLDLWRQRQELTLALEIQAKLEVELRHAKTAAEEASQAKSAFLAAMSHDIRTPMNAILGMGEILKESGLDPKQSRALNVLTHAGENLLALINDILDLSKVEAGQLRLENIAFNLHDLTRGTHQILQQKAHAKGIDLVVNLQQGVPPVVMGDPERLRQVLLNLLGNAVKFTDKGAVTLTVDALEEDSIQFTVADTGIGIPEDQLQRIFNPFRQAEDSTTRRFGGTGLGLSICNRLVHAMGGEIWVESAFGAGSSFHFTTRLPRTAEPPDAQAEASTSPPSKKGADAALEILLVDDAEDNRMVITAYLNQTPHRITEAVNGEEGVRLFTSGAFDLVLMDIQMPVMNGLEAAERIRAWEKERGRPRTPIIALTANAMREDIENTTRAGCDLHLSKPTRKARLIEVLDRFHPRENAP